jgi:hypothetical protein
VELRYDAVDFGPSTDVGASATVGLHVSPSSWAQFGFDVAALADGMAIRLSAVRLR